MNEYSGAQASLSERLFKRSVVIAKIGIGAFLLNTISFVIDYMIKTAMSIEISDVRILEVDSASGWRLDGSWLPNFVVSEVSINCNSISMEVCD